MAEVLSFLFAVVLLLGALHGFRLFCRDVIARRIARAPRPGSHAADTAPLDGELWRG